MPVKLLKTKWYIVDLNTKCVAVDHAYTGFWKAVESERKLDRMERFTAMRGSHIMLHAGKPWIIPLTLEEAERLRDEEQDQPVSEALGPGSRNGEDDERMDVRSNSSNTGNRAAGSAGIVSG